LLLRASLLHARAFLGELPTPHLTSGAPVAAMTVTAWHSGRYRLIASLVSELFACAFKPPDDSNSSAFRLTADGIG